MKKYIGFLIVLGVFVFGAFMISNSVYASVLDNGCSNREIYSSTTGQACPIVVNDGCSSGEIYSSTTGQLCPNMLDNGCSNSEVYSSTTGQACTEQKFTGYLSAKQGGSITMWGTHTITIDTGIRCITTPCPASKSYSVSAGSTSVLSDLRRYENNRITISGKLSYYNLEGGFWGIVASKVIPLSTTLPVISGVSGPQSLNVNQTGTWKVTASSPNGGNLSYSVNWGDVYYATSEVQPSISIQQSATFTHSYSLARTYTPIFTVTNESGQSATTSLSVEVDASNNGCLAGYIYSPITGQKCSEKMWTCSSSSTTGCVFPTTPITRTLNVGTKGEDVKTLQAFLGVTADGSFGPITKAKVIEWQESNSITPDGVFGPMSRQKAGLE